MNNYLNLDEFIDIIVEDIKDTLQPNEELLMKFRHSFSSIAADEILQKKSIASSYSGEESLYYISSNHYEPVSSALREVGLSSSTSECGSIGLIFVPVNSDITEQAIQLKKELSSANQNLSYQK